MVTQVTQSLFVLNESLSKLLSDAEARETRNASLQQNIDKIIQDISNEIIKNENVLLTFATQARSPKKQENINFRDLLKNINSNIKTGSSNTLKCREIINKISSINKTAFKNKLKIEIFNKGEFIQKSAEERKYSVPSIPNTNASSAWRYLLDLPALTTEERETAQFMFQYRALNLGSKVPGVTQQTIDNLFAEMMAAWIDAQKIPISMLDISKQGLFFLAPYLTYLDLTDFFDDLKAGDWTANDIFDLISYTSPKLKTLIIHTDIVTMLPVYMPKLQKLDCSLCTKLQDIPDCPLLKYFNGTGCISMLTPTLPKIVNLIK